MNNYAPIAFFVYNRLDHTKKTIEHLKKNRLSKETSLFIFSDGSKGQNDKKEVNQVREFIKNIDGFSEVQIFESKINKGLADSIEYGVTKTVKEFGKVIVLEDDIVTSPGFLEYHNNALDLYENNERVMHIAGYMFPVGLKDNTTFFFRVADCWGWSTWEDAWDKYRNDSENLKKEIIQSGRLKEFNINNTYNFMNQIDMNIEGKKKTWAVKWYASVFLNNGLCLHPKQSLVHNIGLDGSGTNTGKENFYDNLNLPEFINVQKIEIKESKKIVKQIENFFSGRSVNQEQKFLKVLKKVKNFLTNLT